MMLASMMQHPFIFSNRIILVRATMNLEPFFWEHWVLGWKTLNS